MSTTARSKTFSSPPVAWRREHDLMWQVWDAAGGNGNPDAWSRLAEPAVRRRIVPLILAAWDKDMDAIAHLEHALELQEAK